MATNCPIGFDVAALREEIIRTYERVAHEPDSAFHFHRGSAYARDMLGYDGNELRQLPAAATERFAGVGNPLRIGPIWAGEHVLDHACGAGMDALLAARRVGPKGRVTGVDLTPAMREVATSTAAAAGLSDRIAIVAGEMEALPVADATVDVVISNGVVNLAPDKMQVFREIRRVLKPGGRLYLADVVAERELAVAAREMPALWAACIGGALMREELARIAADAGLEGGRVMETFDCFRHTSVAEKMASLEIRSVNFAARKAG
ncbi:MAG: methyltransferase domain-containing protein [Ectothiorhodospiraceae bacterium]|nr:methyltransferase domain-containing protein [Ectothiorhodospiraceae bacterium]MCH8505253.1 methyltransferase domain-containing protein [Ectothiorhodospiraceae bacterium]